MKEQGNKILKNEIISVVAHELRAPLTSILGSLNIILSKMHDKPITEAIDLLEISYNTGIRMKNLIDNLLDIDKIEARKIELNIEQLNLLEIIKSSVDELKSQITAKNIKINIQNCEFLVYCDYNAGIRIFNNLLSNAIKFSEESSEIDIFAEQYSGNSNFVIIVVRDYGRGLPDNFKDKAFTKFQQADATDASVKGGSGLGLAITKMLVELHGGKIWFESEYGKGASFYFTLRCR